MTGEILPSGHHDFISDEDRRNQEQINPIVLEARYGELCTDLRGTVFQILLAHRAMIEGEGWAMFDLNLGESGSVAMADGEIDVLISTSLAPDARELNGRPLPGIHIMTRELIVGLNGNRSFLSSDFTLDAQNDAQYFPDAVSLDGAKAGTTLASPASFFYFDEQSKCLKILNRPPHYFTQSPGIAYEGDIVRPFGTYQCLEDRLYSLQAATEILDTIATLKPHRTIRDTMD